MVHSQTNEQPTTAARECPAVPRWIPALGSQKNEQDGSAHNACDTSEGPPEMKA
jgi:hypothetical protein